MYLDYYGLTSKPFSIVPNPELFYPSAKHKMALTYLEYGLTQGESFILLTGEIGAGKTTLLRRLLDRLNADVDVAVIFNTNIGADVMVKMILQEFEVQDVSSDKSDNLDTLNTYLLNNFERGVRSLIIVDEAQNLSREALEEIRMLSNLHTSDQSLVQIILSGQPELRDRMRDPALAQLAQRIAVTYHLGPLSREELAEYVEHRLREAGRSAPGPFTDQALDLIYESSRGIPRVTNTLCDTSLVYGYADEMTEIGPETVRGVLSDREETGVDLGAGGEVWNLPPECVVPSADTTSAAGGDSALHSRMLMMESRVNRLEELVASQMRELTAEAEKQRDRVVDSLQQLLTSERERNAKLMRALVAYQKRARQHPDAKSARQASKAADNKISADASSGAATESAKPASAQTSPHAVSEDSAASAPVQQVANPQPAPAPLPDFEEPPPSLSWDPAEPGASVDTEGAEGSKVADDAFPDSLVRKDEPASFLTGGAEKSQEEPDGDSDDDGDGSRRGSLFRLFGRR